MEEFGRTEVILDGSGHLEEARELVDVRLEVADLTWAWEGQGLMAEGAVRAYIYFEKDDGTVEGEGVEIPFHAVVAPPGAGTEEAQVRLDSVREEHQFDPRDRSFSQTIWVELVAESPAPVETADAGPMAALAAPDSAQESEGTGEPEPALVEPEAERPAAEEPPLPTEPVPTLTAGPPEGGPEESEQPLAEPEPFEPEAVEVEPEAAPQPEPLPELALVAPPRAPSGAEADQEAQPTPAPVDDSVIVWKPFPEE